VHCEGRLLHVHRDRSRASAHFLRLNVLAANGDPQRNHEALVEAVEALHALAFVHAACWVQLGDLMKPLRVVDPQLASRIQERARLSGPDESL